MVKAGDLLLKQDTCPERGPAPRGRGRGRSGPGQLDRAKELLAEASSPRPNTISRRGHLRPRRRSPPLKAVIAKKTIRAPFAGRLGIRLVNLGQILKEGDPIVSLQTLDPIFVNFHLPQQELSARSRPACRSG